MGFRFGKTALGFNWQQQALLVFNVLPGGNLDLMNLSFPYCQDLPGFAIVGTQVSWGIGMGDGKSVHESQVWGLGRKG